MGKTNLIHGNRWVETLTRLALLILALICGIRIAVTVGFLKPVIGGNSVEHYLPIADLT